jgi:prephenate dehydrogenase
MIQTLTIVGVGLIGGSIGLAAKKREVAQRVLGVGHRKASLDQAVARGAVDEPFLDLSEAVHQADLAIFCTPVDLIAEQILAAAPGCKAGALLTDAGSTKATIVRRVTERRPNHVAFVGSHPLAGSEKRGVEFAHADLLEGRVTVVTKTSETAPADLNRTIAFWRSLGSEVIVMDPEEHDRALAMTSHLPHLVASALVGALTPSLFPLTGTGFRDTTRVAAGDPALWTGIFLQNRESLLGAMDRMGIQLDYFRRALLASDRTALDQLFGYAKRLRDSLEH